MPHLSLWRHTCLSLGPPICLVWKQGVDVGGGGGREPYGYEVSALGLGRRNTPQVRGTTLSVAHGKSHT